MKILIDISDDGDVCIYDITTDTKRLLGEYIYNENKIYEMKNLKRYEYVNVKVILQSFIHFS